jgi:hypothetical protein
VITQSFIRSESAIVSLPGCVLAGPNCDELYGVRRKRLVVAHGESFLKQKRP